MTEPRNYLLRMVVFIVLVLAMLAFAMGLDPLYVGAHHLARFMVLGLAMPFIVAGTSVLLVASVSVSFLSFKAAAANPGDSLRHE